MVGKETVWFRVMTATHILCFTSCLKCHDDTVGVLITDVLDLTEFLRLKNQNERSIIKYSVQLPFNISSFWSNYHRNNQHRPHHKVRHQLLLLLLSDPQDSQGSGSVVDHHAVHVASHHLTASAPAAAHVHRAGLQGHLPSAAASTRWRPYQTQPSRLKEDRSGGLML